MIFRKSFGLLHVFLFVGSSHTWPDGESPLDHITNAAYCLACAVKSKKTDANSHLQLGLVLEEKYRAQDVYAIKKDVSLSTHCFFTCSFVLVCLRLIVSFESMLCCVLDVSATYVFV